MLKLNIAFLLSVLSFGFAYAEAPSMPARLEYSYQITHPLVIFDASPVTIDFKLPQSGSFSGEGNSEWTMTGLGGLAGCIGRYPNVHYALSGIREGQQIKFTTN